MKGKKFDIPTLLTGTEKEDQTFSELSKDPKCGLAIARLAPQDYHRFHSPVEGEVMAVKDIKGELYSEWLLWRIADPKSRQPSSNQRR